MNITQDSTIINIKQSISYKNFVDDILNDYFICCLSREVSLIGRKEVLTGKAKFGIFGDGKELPQIAMAKAFKNGDFRSGYYRDQTFMLASNLVTVSQLFAQLYANPSLAEDPHSGGRQMNNHFATRSLYPNGEWRILKNQKNTAADNSPTASQMLRALGLASASKKYRQLNQLIGENIFSDNGNEICFATIGDASTSEGIFWETINAAGVMQVPLIVSVWDDGYGISVPKELQTTKSSISEVLKGFQQDESTNGFDIYKVKAWDYTALVSTYLQAADKTRQTHIPAIIHVEEVTQQQGHSTSGSHERYKSKERLDWEKEHDCILKFKQWILATHLATEEQLTELERTAKQQAQEQKKIAWQKFHQPIKKEIEVVITLMEKIILANPEFSDAIYEQIDLLKQEIDPMRKEIFQTIDTVLIILKDHSSLEKNNLLQWYREQYKVNEERYSSYQFTNSKYAPSKATIVPVAYTSESKILSGYQVLNACFDANFKRDVTIVAFGEDVGKIGDVNQAFSGLQEKYGVERIYDCGIREATIVGEAIGLAMRGFRPIAEIQYLDYLLYGLQPLADDVACLSYRSKAGQKAPLIIRTRGHRLEGIWHTGSPMQLILGALRGMHICVPRNMTQAAGFYNLLLRSDEPAIVIECLNGYRLKEKIPSNAGDFTVPLGVPEILVVGKDITLVTYGSCIRIAQEAIAILKKLDIYVELIDVQTLLPFDVTNTISTSIQKTNKVIFLDEDYPGGATSFMMQQVIEKQEAFRYLDAAPITITAKEHRAAFGTDGDYFCKPNVHDIVKEAVALMRNINPNKFKNLY